MVSARITFSIQVFQDTDGSWIARSKGGNIGKGRSPASAIEACENAIQALPVRDLEPQPKHPHMTSETGVEFIARATVIETRRAMYRQWVWELKE